jgi:hypothetical protein
MLTVAHQNLCLTFGSRSAGAPQPASRRRRCPATSLRVLELHGDDGGRSLSVTFPDRGKDFVQRLGWFSLSYRWKQAVGRPGIRNSIGNDADAVAGLHGGCSAGECHEG